DNMLYNNDKRGLSFGGYDYPSTGKVQHCKFYNNTCYKNDVLHDGAGELYIEYALNCEVKNNLFYCGDQNLLLNCLQGNADGNIFNYNLYYSELPGNNHFDYDGSQYNSFSSYKSATAQDANSLFMNPLLNNPAVNNFHLTASSPGKNAGDPVFLPATGELDYYGGNRYLNNRIDIGADEYDPSERLSEQVMNTFDLKVYPAIVQESITVSFIFHQDEEVLITLTDLSGKIMKLLLDQELSEGSYQYQFEVNDFIPGIYFIQVNSNQNSAVTRIVIAR
ncbi:MAG: T9SS type A sorting domain-containing protein, partial [Chitinophagales bacterium]